MRWCGDAGQHFVGLNRLGDVVHRAELQPGHLVGDVAERREEDHDGLLRLGVGLERAAHFEAVDVGHHDVEQHQVGLRAADDLQRRAAVARGEDAVAGAVERPDQHLQVHRAVVHDEDRRLRRRQLRLVPGWSPARPHPRRARRRGRATRRSRTRDPSRPSAARAPLQPRPPETSSWASVSRSVIDRRRTPASARRAAMSRRRGPSSTAGSDGGGAGCEPDTKRTPRCVRSIANSVLGAHRLLQVVDAAGFTRRLARVAERAGGHRDDGDRGRRRGRFQAPRRLEPVQVAHLHVHEDDVRQVLARQRDRLEAACRRDHPHAGALEQGGENPAVHRAVVGDERRHLFAFGETGVERRRRQLRVRWTRLGRRPPRTSASSKKKRLPSRAGSPRAGVRPSCR